MLSDLKKWMKALAFLSFSSLLFSLVLAGCQMSRGESRVVLKMVSTSEPRSFDPYLAQPLKEKRWSKLFFSGLWRVNEKGEVEEGLAYRPVFREGGRKVEVRLKENLKWSDGEPLIAGDVEFTWKVLKGKVDPEYQPDLYPAYDYIEKVEVKDERNLVFYLKKPFYQFGFLFPAILPRHKLEKEKSIRNSPFWLNPVGSGPYRLKKFELGKRMECEVNPYFQGSLPKIKKIEVSFVNQERAVKLISQGKVDLWQDITEEEAKRLKKEKISLRGYPISWQSVFLNARDSLLSKLERRKAIIAGIDWSKVLRFLKKKEAGLYGLPPFSSYVDLVKTYKVFLNRPYSVKVLNSEGYKNLRKDGLWEKRKDELFIYYLTFDIEQQNYNTILNEAWVRLISKEAERTGMSPRAITRGTKVLNSSSEKGGALAKGAYQLLIYSQTFYPHPLLRKVFSAEEKPVSRLDGLNFTFYSSKNIEENYQKAEKNPSLSKQKEFLKKIYKEVNKQALLVPLGYNYLYYYAVPRLKNYKPPLFWETSFLNVENWELE